ncbi:creatininase family protein [Caldifermentibacillus hisashii]|nr:creatininase family protein [Caldifermentibacillus hisashii]
MIHACEFETSLLLFLHPEYVQMDKAVKESPERPLLYGKSSISLGDLSKTGVFGDPTLANKEKGNKMINEFVQKMVKLVQLAFQEN